MPIPRENRVPGADPCLRAGEATSPEALVIVVGTSAIVREAVER